MNFIESMMLYYGNGLTMDENESKITGKITSEMVEDFESRIIRPKRPYSPSIGVKETKASTIPAETIAADKISTINMIIADEHKDTEDKDLDKSFDHRHLKEKLPRATWEEISTNLTASLNEFFLESEDNRKLFKFKLINSVIDFHLMPNMRSRYQCHLILFLCPDEQYVYA